MDDRFAVRIAPDGATFPVDTYRRWAIPPHSRAIRLGPLLVHRAPQAHGQSVNRFARHLWSEIAGGGAAPMFRGPVWVTPHPNAGAPPTRNPWYLDHVIKDILRSTPKTRRRRWDLSVATMPGGHPDGFSGHGIAYDVDSGRRAVALCDAGNGGLAGGYARRHAAALAARAVGAGDPFRALRRQLDVVRAEPYSWGGSLSGVIVATWRVRDAFLRLAWSGSIAAYCLRTPGVVFGVPVREDRGTGPVGPLAYREVSMRTASWLALATPGVNLHAAINRGHVYESLDCGDDPKDAAGRLARATASPGAEGAVLVVDLHHVYRKSAA
ncbi:hypothetical protein [Kitasatospora brasiliensis]|uniref:hypothetical protein n=1 Tax=Kitasatospora brasiliensis TaxID=3058040 RepID=UPI002931C5E2|nr:hypothetical protein [Kitasatospora sp. K002]